MQVWRIGWQRKEIEGFLLPYWHMLLQCPTRMPGRVLHTTPWALVHAFTTIIDTSHHNFPIYRTKTTLGWSCILLAQKAEHIHALACSARAANGLPWFVPGLREIGR